METLLTGPVESVVAHAIPFRTIFEEHLRREKLDSNLPRDQKLWSAVQRVLNTSTPAEVPLLLKKLIARQEIAYRRLAQVNQAISEGRSPRWHPEECISRCKIFDDKLKALLHAMDCSALCLSGGGIRSASFCLGVLEGLARFSNPDKPSGGLMYELDYLSTVSGGGYVGSWLTSWIDQQRRADGYFTPIANTIAALQECEESLALLGPGIPPAVTNKVIKACTKRLVAIGSGDRSSILEVRTYLAKILGQALATLTSQPMWKPVGRAAIWLQKKIAPPKPQRKISALLRASIAAVVTKPNKATIETTHTQLRTDTRERTQQAYFDVVAAMAGKRPVTSGDAEQATIRHLRRYTSYLAPSVGLTLDMFTLIAIVSRNMLVNWVMLIPVVIAVVAGIRLVGISIAGFDGTESNGMVYDVTVFFLLSAIVAAIALPSHYKKRPAKLWWIFAPVFRIFVVIACSFLTVWKVERQWHFLSGGSFWLFHKINNLLVITLLNFTVVAISIWLAHWARLKEIPRRTWGLKVLSIAATLIAIPAVSALTMWLLYLARELYPFLRSGTQSVFLPLDNGRELFTIFALPITITIIMATTSLFCALLGLFEVEEDREWWARCGGAMLIFNLLWVAAHSVTFYGRVWLAGIVGIGLGLAGSLVGFSGITAAGPRPVKAAQINAFGQFLERHKLLLPLVGTVSLFLIVLGIVGVSDGIRDAIHTQMSACTISGSTICMSSAWEVSFLKWFHLEGHADAVMLFISSLIFSLAINLAININLFSLHGMYRMRLMRAFLGASNVMRRPDPSTNFDPTDTPYEMDLPACAGVPLHMINATLNLTGTKNTAWKQRRAESFTISPIQCGGWRVGYARTNVYGGSKGMTLATAMSISGAAFNPNMGYQTSAVLSLLMTFFNLRLGCWMPNPKRPIPKLGLGFRNKVFFRQPGPTFALQPLLEEVAGLTDDDNRWIELTDGGHFENLGLYEMVMRRCKRIIVVDAGADPTCKFEDLGNAVRKIQIDLGIPIVFPQALTMQGGAKSSNSYCAVAAIRYNCVDENASDGYLIYIKAGLTGAEPVDILQYAKTHTSFPHETTGNQFFNESQFESYRHLGSFVVQSISDNVPQPKGLRKLWSQTLVKNSMDDFKDGAVRYWRKAPPNQSKDS